LAFFTSTPRFAIIQSGELILSLQISFGDHNFEQGSGREAVVACGRLPLAAVLPKKRLWFKLEYRSNLASWR
jgi:hypothetical protein